MPKLSDLRNPEKVEELKKVIAQETICPLCNKPMNNTDIQESRNDSMIFGGELVHADCYYGQFSRVIEKRPIHTPGFPLSAK